MEHVHISIKREEFLKPLSQVAGIVERRQTSPILSNILMRAAEEELVVTGTDLEVEVVARLSLKPKGEGEVTVPARKLVDICRALPAEAVLDIKQDGDKVTVQSGKSRFSLLTLPPADFPNLETSDWDLNLKLPQRAFKGLLERTQFSMAQQDVRYYLNGLLLEFTPGRAKAVATDGHRMAVSEIAVASVGEQDRQVIVPRKGVLELVRFLEDEDEEILLQLSGNHIRVDLGALTFTSKLIDGRFPDYNKVIPTSQTKLINVDREQFRNALHRAAILSNEKYRGIRVKVRSGSMTISAHNPEQEEAEEELPIEYDGEEMEIGFNSNYVIEAVGAINADQVEFGLTDSNSSGTLCPPGSKDTQYVVMPMRL